MTEYPMHNPVWMLAVAWAAGAMLGGIFFGGLGLTVRRLLATDHPALWVLGSFLLRSSTVMGSFYLVAGDSWQHLLACLLGFAMARQLVKHLTRSRDASVAIPMQQPCVSPHAP